MAWLLLEATLSCPSRRKLVELGREPEMLKAAPWRGDPAGTSWTPGMREPRVRKLRLKSGSSSNCWREMAATIVGSKSFWTVGAVWPAGTGCEDGCDRGAAGGGGGTLGLVGVV